MAYLQVIFANVAFFYNLALNIHYIQCWGLCMFVSSFTIKLIIILKKLEGQYVFFASYFLATIFDCSGKPFASCADCKLFIF
jgi:hypothetical protein